MKEWTSQSCIQSVSFMKNHSETDERKRMRDVFVNEILCMREGKFLF